jgi:hypothetical protein
VKGQEKLGHAYNNQKKARVALPIYKTNLKKNLLLKRGKTFYNHKRVYSPERHHQYKCICMYQYGHKYIKSKWTEMREK